MTKFSDQIRRAIVNCGTTRYRLSKETRIAQSTLSRFVNRKCNLSLNQLDKLAEYIGFGITTKNRGS